jgi:hypothetical protein
MVPKRTRDSEVREQCHALGLTQRSVESRAVVTDQIEFSKQCELNHDAFLLV